MDTKFMRGCCEDFLDVGAYRTRLPERLIELFDSLGTLRMYWHYTGLVNPKP